MPIRIVSFIVALMLLFPVHPLSAWAQTPNNNSANSFGPRKQIATIIFSGLAGAILGLSTLSFYGRPQDKLSNIGAGLAIGIIVGTGYTSYLAATRPKSYFDSSFIPQWEEEEKMTQKYAFHHDPSFQQKTFLEKSAPLFRFNWDF